MRKTPKHLVDEFGGYRAVALRMGLNEKTMHQYAARDRLPSGLYSAFCDLAHEMRVTPPSMDLFDFKPLQVSVADGGVAA